MDYCSLEDDDYSGVFITQEPQKIVPLVPNFEEEGTDGTGGDEAMEIGGQNTAQYSDISDFEDFDIPSSQQERHIRYIFIYL